MDKTAAFNQFKEACAAEGLLQNDFSPEGDDLRSGIHDDGTLLRFLRAREFNVENALQQYKTTRVWRDANRLVEIYDLIDVSSYEETRKLYTHWTGRRARNGTPICVFEIQQLTPSVMAAYDKSCSSTVRPPTSTESESMLRLFCTYENLIRFILPLCSAVPSRPDPTSPITDTTCIIDVTGVSLLQFWRLRTHLQAASTLATSHYPETLGRTFIIGAPSFFSTIWSWISKWFDAHTVSKILIVPQGQEHSMLSETIDPIHIPVKYGGQCEFTFGMLPDLDGEMKEMVAWLNTDGGRNNDDGNEKTQEMPEGPLRWVEREGGKRTVIAVGTVDGKRRNKAIMTLR